MKKFLFLVCIIFLSTPAWALCSIDSGESVCTLPANSSPLPLFQNNAGINSSGNETPRPKTSANSNKGTSFGRVKNQNGLQMQGSLGCQFGNCNKDINNR